jgi:hypothetical protein
MNMKFAVILLSLLLLAGNLVAGQGSFQLDHVDGLTAEGHIPTGAFITFHLRLTNDTDLDLKGFTNGFRVFSPNGADWTTLSAASTDALGPDDFDFIYGISHINTDGEGADTVGFAGSVGENPYGAPAGFDSVTHTIQIGPLGASSHALTVCLDSTF